MVQVVAAVLHSEGKILVGQRMPEQSHPLKWEFPGGKVEPGESPEQALARELEEELGISGAAGEVITRYHFTYPGKDPDRPVLLPPPPVPRRAAKPDLSRPPLAAQVPARHPGFRGRRPGIHPRHLY